MHSTYVYHIYMYINTSLYILVATRYTYMCTYMYSCCVYRSSKNVKKM